jgi:hypothetical protein
MGYEKVSIYFPGIALNRCRRYSNCFKQQYKNNKKHKQQAH